MAVNGQGANRSRNWSGCETWRGFTAIDLATGAYVLVATGAVLYSFQGEGIRGWPWVLSAHALIAALVLIAPRARNAGPIGRFLGDWYPMLLLPALYGEIGVLTLSAGFQNDLLIQRLETWVFGSQISYRWIRESPNIVLSWLLHALPRVLPDSVRRSVCALDGRPARRVAAHDLRNHGDVLPLLRGLPLLS